MQEPLEQPLERLAGLVVHERQSKDHRLAEIVAADERGEMTEADAVPTNDVEGDDIAELAVVDDHPRVDPENIRYFVLNIQLHGMVERRVGQRLLLEVVQQGGGLSVLHLPLPPSPQGAFTDGTHAGITVRKIRWWNRGIMEVEGTGHAAGRGEERVVVARLESVDLEPVAGIVAADDEVGVAAGAGFSQENGGAVVGLGGGAGLLLLVSLAGAG